MDGPAPAIAAVVGRGGLGTGRDGPEGESAAAATAQDAGEAVLMDVDDHIQPSIPGGGGYGHHSRQVSLVIAARLRLESLPDEREADRVEAQVDSAVEDGDVTHGDERGELAAADVDPAEEDHAAVRRDESAPGDAEHHRAPGRRGGRKRGDRLTTRQDRHPAGHRDEQAQDGDHPPLHRPSAGMRRRRRGEIHGQRPCAARRNAAQRRFDPIQWDSSLPRSRSQAWTLAQVITEFREERKTSSLARPVKKRSAAPVSLTSHEVPWARRNPSRPTPAGHGAVVPLPRPAAAGRGCP